MRSKKADSLRSHSKNGVRLRLWLLLHTSASVLLVHLPSMSTCCLLLCWLVNALQMNVFYNVRSPGAPLDGPEAFSLDVLVLDNQRDPDHMVLSICTG